MAVNCDGGGRGWQDRKGLSFRVIHDIQEGALNVAAKYRAGYFLETAQQPRELRMVPQIVQQFDCELGAPALHDEKPVLL
jgi:hypothetical protein